MCTIRYDWLIAIYLFISLVRNASFLIIKTVVSGKKSAMSTNHCARTSCWWVRACAPQLWFLHLPNWHFSLHLTHLQRPGVCAIENFQRLRFGSLPTSSQERVKQESRYTFKFTLRTIYEVNGTARYLESCWPATNNDTILTLYLIHTLSLNISALYRASNQLIHRTIDPFINTSIDQSFIGKYIDWSIHQSINSEIIWSIHPSIHQSIDPSIHP